MEALITYRIEKKTLISYRYRIESEKSLSPKGAPDPNSGNMVLFFGRQKRRFARMTGKNFDADNEGCNDLYIIGAVCNEKAPLSVFKRFGCFSCF